MTTADHILDQIDACLGDYSVSDDAMRSRPASDVSAEPFAMGGIIPTMQIMDEAGEWQPLGSVADVGFGTREAVIVISVDTAAATAALERIRQLHEVLAEAAQSRTEEAGRGLAAFAKAMQCAEPNDDCRPARRPDRPAWQSPYGPPRRRR